MNNLEFIENEINLYKNAIKISSDKQKKTYYKQTIKHLQQIKSELEAWEICKNDCVIFPVIKDFADGKGINWHRLPKKQQETLKKALEVKENENI